MDVKRIIKELKHKYPNRTIICLPKDSPKEIVCEIEPTSDHPDWSNVIAIVGKSEPHYHKISTEVYEVFKGTLAIYLDDKKHVLHEGDTMTIKPGPVHYAEAEGDECWFYTSSKPGWTKEDHILI